MPKNPNVKRVMVIGSGPIVIGQAAEFDYAGTQACRSLKEEGVEVILVNSNPATIMTDKDIADKVYIEPLTVKVLEQIIEKEKPDSILPTLGGQAGLNLIMGNTAAGAAKGISRTKYYRIPDCIGKFNTVLHIFNHLGGCAGFSDSFHQILKFLTSLCVPDSCCGCSEQCHTAGRQA